jgi:peroxiredoxin
VKSERLVKYIVAVGTEGIAQIGYPDFLEHPVITLQPWVTVKGDLMMGTQPAIGYALETRTRDELEHRGGYYAYSDSITDAQGHFEFSRIPPGHMILHGREYEVHAGQTYELHLGVGGQSVVGQYTLPGYAYQEHVLSGGPMISKVISLASGMRPMEISPLGETAKPQVFQQISSNEMGQFQVDHLEPGHYALLGRSFKNRTLDPQKHACRLWHEFEVPERSHAAQGDVPIDLGTIELIPGDLMVGDSASEFDLEDLAGNLQSLTDLAGKLVLLSFCRSNDLQSPSLALRALNDIQAQFGSMESFVMIGMLASMNSPSQDQALVKAAGFTWPHLAVGRNGRNRTHIDYDVLNTPWPWNILISPDGIVLAIGLQGDELVEAIETHLP